MDRAHDRRGSVGVGVPLPNFEGLAWMEDGSAVLLNDNKYRGVSREPSRLYFIPASAIQ